MGIVSGEEKADTLLCLRGARSRFEGPIGSFSMYVCDCILVLRMVLLF